MRPDRSTIHALVVGISKYSLKQADLEGPVADALLFAKWLRKDNQIAPENIRLFLSPTEEGTEECARQAKALELDYLPAIKRHLDDYFDKSFPSGALFLLYWSGHGVIDKKNQRYLFFSDATETALNYHLDVRNTFDFLRGKSFSKQIGFIDTCAKSVSWDLGTNTRTVSGGSAEQSYLFAASPGQAAADFKSRRTSYFSEKLLEVLKQNPFPPEASTAIKAMRNQFAQHAEQRPQYFAYKDFDSDESILGHRPISSYVQSVASLNDIPIQGLRRLADIAAQGDKLSQRSVRDKLFAELLEQTDGLDLARPGFFNFDPSDDLIQMFAGALDRGIVNALCDSMNRLDAESLPVRRVLGVLPQLQEAVKLTRSFTVEAALPAFSSSKSSAALITEWDSVSWMIWSLADSIHLLEPVAEFLLRLANQVNGILRERLTTWAARYVDESLIEGIAEEVENEPAFLFIDIERTDSTQDGQDIVEAFLRRGPLTIHVWPARKSKCRDLDSVIDTITFDAEKLVHGFFVQILVPREMFDWTPHSILLDKEQLGVYFPVALRWRERVHRMPRTRYQEWIARAQKIRLHLGAGCCNCCRWFDFKTSTFIPGEPGLLAFSSPNFDAIRQHVKDGAPFAIWPPTDPGNDADLRSAVDGLSAGAAGLDKVPHELKERRSQHSAPDISLFWDDPQQLKTWKLIEP
jgi:hypothetical protein